MEDKPIFSPFSHEDLIPQPECLEIPRKREKFSIGIPKETNKQEKRIGLTPDAVEVLVNNGHHISIETNAGEGANFTDREYAEAGAEIVYSSQAIFEKSIILKVGPLTPQEIEWIKPSTLLISSVPTNALDKAYFTELSKKKITAIGYEYIKDRKICAQNLRYKFGVSREAVPLNKRIKEPYRFTFSGNFLIPRNIFLTLNISDQNQYGMDLLFSSLLMKNQIQIKHINNPIYHIGLEENQVFVKKSISAVTYRFSLRNEIHYELERKHKLISKCYLDRAILLCYKTFKSKIEKNLTSTRPNLLLYDFYRLGHYISLHKG